MRTLVLLALIPAMSLARTPHASWPSATLSNGFAAAVFDRPSSRLRDAWPHAYREAAAGRTTPDLLWDAYFGFSRGGPGLWNPSLSPVTESYENGTGIFTVVREVGDIRLTERWFAPMTLPVAGIVAHLTVRNLGTAPIPGSRAAFLLNLHVGEGSPEASSDRERITWHDDCSCLAEQGVLSGRSGVAVPFPAPDVRAWSPSNPYQSFPRDGTLGAPGTGEPQDDAVSAFAWDLPTLPPGGESSVSVVLGLSEAGDPLPLARAIRDWLGGDPLDAEREFWRAFHGRTPWPDDLRGDSLSTARQALAWLAMGQVREPDGPAGTPHGQILASLPPGAWNRTWVRDQAYAVAALSATGHADRAAEAVRFLSRARTGAFREQVGGDYGVSVCRYYGLGQEESDGDPALEGPNIEFDGFGLALWSLAEVAARRPDLLPEVWPWAGDRVAAPLASLVQPSGLVRPDSSIWERHWNGREKHFTYTQVTAVLGLCAAWQLGERMNDPRSGSWRTAARTVARALDRLLVTPGGVLAGSLEEIPSGRFLDAAVVEAFLWGILSPSGEVAARTLDALLQGLAVPPGLRRNDDGDWYDRQEWVFIDLRVAEALRRAGRDREADGIARWVLDQTRANLDLPAELYEETTADYEGAVPMMGFGAGALLLWLVHADPAVDVPACLKESPPDLPGPEDPGGVPEVPPEDRPEDLPEGAFQDLPDTGSDPREEAFPADASEPVGDPAAGDGPPDPPAPRKAGCAAGAGAGSPAGWPGILACLLGIRRIRRRPHPGHSGESPLCFSPETAQEASMVRLRVALVLVLLPLACGGEDGIRLVLTGRVWTGPGMEQGREGVRVEIPRTGASTLTGPDGSFRLATRLPEAPDGGSEETAVRFVREGFAPVTETLRAFPGEESTLVTWMAQPARTVEIRIPAGENEALVEDQNGTLRFRRDSLADDKDGSVLEGTVRVAVATWDPSWNPGEDHPDAWTIPLPRTPASSPSADTRLEPLAAVWFDLDRGVPNPDPGVGIEAFCRYGDIAFPGISSGTRDLFLVDPITGTAERLAEGRVEAGPKIFFAAVRTGLWVWARPDPAATCVTARVTRGRRPASGAVLDLWETDLRGGLKQHLDRQAGAADGAFCLKGPAGRQARLDAYLALQGIPAIETRTVVTSGGGTCSTGCPTVLEVAFPCLSDGDCDPGETCSDGRCAPPPEAL